MHMSKTILLSARVTMLAVVGLLLPAGQAQAEFIGQARGTVSCRVYPLGATELYSATSESSLNADTYPPQTQYEDMVDVPDLAHADTEVLNEDIWAEAVGSAIARDLTIIPPYSYVGASARGRVADPGYVFAEAGSLVQAFASLPNVTFSGNAEVTVSHSYLVDLLNAFPPEYPHTLRGIVRLEVAFGREGGDMLLTPQGDWSLAGSSLVIEVESETAGFFEERMTQNTAWSVPIVAGEDYYMSAIMYAEVEVPPAGPPSSAWVLPGLDREGDVNGGSGNVGGIDFVFDEVTAEGVFDGLYTPIDQADLTPEDLMNMNFFLPTDPVMMWDITFDGEFTGFVELTFGYDDSYLLPGFDEEDLFVWHTLPGPTWEQLDVIARDLVNNTITVRTDSFSTFALAGPVPEPATMTLLVVGGVVLLKRKQR